MSPIACPSDCDAGHQPWGLAVGPNGQFLYSANAESHTVSPFSIAADGALPPIACGSESEVTSSDPEDVAVSPNGQFLYTTNNNLPTSSVPAFEIQMDGALTPIASCGSDCKTTDGAEPEGVMVRPDGRFVYSSDREDVLLPKPFEDGIVSAFAIGSGRELSELECPELTCALGENTGFFGLTITPDRVPRRH